MTTTPEKSAASKPKPVAASEKSQPEASKPEASRPGTNQGESSSKNVNAGAMDFAALLNKKMEEFKNMMISTQQQKTVMIEQMQTQNEMRFAKIEAELSNFIPAVDQRFGEVERRVDEEETSSQASVLELQKVQTYLNQQIAESREKEEVKTAMLKLKHEWGKAYEYLSEFNRLSRILQLTDETRRLLLVQQVRPSVREAFYDLPVEKQTLEDYVTCQRRCDTFPADYKDDYLE